MFDAFASVQLNPASLPFSEEHLIHLMQDLRKVRSKPVAPTTLTELAEWLNISFEACSQAISVQGQPEHHYDPDGPILTHSSKAKAVVSTIIGSIGECRTGAEIFITEKFAGDSDSAARIKRLVRQAVEQPDSSSDIRSGIEVRKHKHTCTAEDGHESAAMKVSKAIDGQFEAVATRAIEQFEIGPYSG